MNRDFLVLYQQTGYLALLERQLVERLRNRAAARPRRQWLTVAGALVLLPLAGFASDDSLSARVRACAAEADSLQRLVCYDKRVAPFAERAPVPTPAADPNFGATARPSQQDSKSNTGPDLPAKDRSAQTESRHIAARVVSINSEHGRMMVHLDNGQAWEQVQEPTEELNLRAGDPVTIDKRSLLGTYWLSSRSGGVMKVRLKE